MKTSSRRIVETEIALTFDESERVAASQNVHDLATDVARRTRSVCQAVGGTCLLRSTVQADAKNGAETLTFRCVSDDDAGRQCAMPNAPYLASDEASNELYKVLAATPKH